MRMRSALVIAAAVATLAVLTATPALAKDRTGGDPLARLSQNIASSWALWNPGGAPVSPGFVQAALQQGLEPSQVNGIFRSQALNGPRTSATFSSPELLQHFTANPDQIPALLRAVDSVKGAARSYAEYLADGGTPGAIYRSYDQRLQEAVLAIPGARDAYLSGTTAAQQDPDVLR